MTVVLLNAAKNHFVKDNFVHVVKKANLKEQIVVDVKTTNIILSAKLVGLPTFKGLSTMLLFTLGLLCGIVVTLVILSSCF